LHIPWAGAVMNAVILTAVLSALNSGLFGSSRILLALTRNGDAPKLLTRLNGRGAPVAAILTGTTFGYLAVVMSYLSPDRVFPFLVTSYGTVAIFVYLLIALAQLRLRARLEREAPERLRVKMWCYPYLTILAIVAIIGGLVAMAFSSDQHLALLFGVVSALTAMGGYFLRRKFGSKARPPSSTAGVDSAVRPHRYPALFRSAGSRAHPDLSRFCSRVRLSAGRTDSAVGLRKREPRHGRSR
jgi:GABA permease